MNNELSNGISLQGSKTRCDAQCKKVLSQKVILAWILKYTTKEFSALSIEVVMDCIEEEPEIGSIPVSFSGREEIDGLPNESSIPEEGVIYYDIRFLAYVPLCREKVRVIVNVEAQKAFYPGYQIVTRGIFYDARMLSAQLGREFTPPGYDDLKKVFSIWICMEAPAFIGNAVSVYEMAKKDLVPGIPDLPEAYDKLVVVIVALNEKKPSGDKFLKMLNVLFSVEKCAEEKRDILERQFHIPMQTDFGKEMGIMCNYSDYVEAKGIEKGIEKGIQCGRTETAQKLLEMGMKPEQIAEATSLSVEYIKELKAERL